jgi:hypothetical protein
MIQTDHVPILVAIETDATRFHGEHPNRPRTLSRTASEQMLAHLSTDLASLFPEITRCSLTMPGALYDQTQLLRPGYPVFQALKSSMEECSGVGDPPLQLGLGVRQGKMPVPDLEPLANIPLGLLLILPMLVSGAAELTRDLSLRMEHQFLESGQVSAHSAQGLEANFGIPVTHARFMTITDLHAMLRMQLEHFGFLPLWELLDAALNDRTELLEVHGRSGQRLHWQAGAVRCEFETFDYWACHGSGRKQPAAERVLAKEYADWTREYRQYLTTLQAHAIPVLQYLPQHETEPLESSFLVEEARAGQAGNSAQVTEHSSGELGTIAVTVTTQGRQLNYYPLTPAGLNDLHASIREAGFSSGGVAFPGCINYDARTRRLIPESLRATR